MDLSDIISLPHIRVERSQDFTCISPEDGYCLLMPDAAPDGGEDSPEPFTTTSSIYLPNEGECPEVSVMEIAEEAADESN